MSARGEFIVVIPARFESTRLPGKLLKDLQGKTVLQRVHEQVMQSSSSRTIIATDNQAIVDHANQISAEVCLTSTKHQSGTQRIAEVIEKLAITDDTIVVNVQGDEPFIPVSCIEQVAGLLQGNSSAMMSTLATQLTDEQELFDPNAVKVVVNRNKEAMYFSRATIPWNRQDYPAGHITPLHLQQTLRHIGIYAYRAGFIKKYVRYEASQLEQIEVLEQLRVLWYGHKILVDIAEQTPRPGIDTQNDLDNAQAFLNKASSSK